MGEVLGIVNRAISTYLVKAAGLSKKAGAKAGSVTLIQRFGGSLNLNIHFHMLFLDGVYSFEGAKPHFYLTAAPTPDEIEKVLQQIAVRVTRFLEKRGLLVKDQEGTYLSIDSDNDEAGLTQLQGSSVTYRIALGPYQGKKALTLQTIPSRESESNGLLAKQAGFSLHAGVACGADERKKLERICRYIARPAVSVERLRVNHRGQVVYRLKKAYDDGTTHIVLSPLDFLARLASIVPRPRVNLTRFFGVFAPHFKHRKQVVPERKSLNKKLSRDAENPTPAEKAARMTWAQRLKRVFAIDIDNCPKCQGKLKIIACLEDPKVIAKILNHLGLSAKLQEPALARPPPSTGESDNHNFFDQQSFPKDDGSAS